MTITPERNASLLEATKPLIKWLNANCHPHCEARVTNSTVELSEMLARNMTNEFIKD